MSCRETVREGYTTLVASPGANLHADPAQVPDRLLGPETTLLLHMEPEAARVAALLRRAASRGARRVLLFSPPQPIAAAALAQAQVLIGNAAEIAWLGEHVGTGNNPASIRTALGADVVRMRGTQGAEAQDASGYMRVAALPVHMRDTTGAGDAFAGVFAAALDRGADIPAALRRAAVAAALCTEGIGGTAPRSDAIEAALARAPEVRRDQAEIMD